MYYVMKKASLRKLHMYCIIPLTWHSGSGQKKDKDVGTDWWLPWVRHGGEVWLWVSMREMWGRIELVCILVVMVFL